jgi:hypothetical protein
VHFDRVPALPLRGLESYAVQVSDHGGIGPENERLPGSTRAAGVVARRQHDDPERGRAPQHPDGANAGEPIGGGTAIRRQEGDQLERRIERRRMQHEVAGLAAGWAARPQVRYERVAVLDHALDHVCRRTPTATHTGELAIELGIRSVQALGFGAWRDRGRGEDLQAGAPFGMRRGPAGSAAAKRRRGATAGRSRVAAVAAQLDACAGDVYDDDCGSADLDPQRLMQLEVGYHGRGSRRAQAGEHGLDDRPITERGPSVEPALDVGPPAGFEIELELETLGFHSGALFVAA